MIRIEVDDREVRRALADLAARVADMRPAMHDIGQALVEGIRAHIRDGQDWRGQPFAPNRAATLAKKRGAKPLIDRGNLVGSRLHFEAGRDHVVVASSAVQSATLQFGARRGAFGKTRRGAPIPWGDIPARPFMPISDAHLLEPEAARVISDVIGDYLADALRARVTGQRRA